MPVPTIEPQIYAPPGAPAADEYQAGQPVWVYRAGAWRPGVVLHSSAKAVMVRYRPAEGPGTGVDTVTNQCLAARSDLDPLLDRAAA
jgi:hypothetical protein